MGPKVNLQLLTNVPRAEEGSTDWGWGAPLPSNANEVGTKLMLLSCCSC